MTKKQQRRRSKAQPHAVLGVPHDASKSEIRAAFHKAAKKYHPDKQTISNENEAAISHFVEIHQFDKDIDDDGTTASTVIMGRGGGRDENIHNDEKKAPRTRPTRESSMNSNKVRKRRNGSRSSFGTEENKPASSSRNGKKQSVTSTPTWRRESVKSHHRHSIHNSPPPSPSSCGISIGIATTPKSQRSLHSVPKLSPTRNSSTSSLKNNSHNKSRIRRSNSSSATATTATASLNRRSRSSLTSPVQPSRPPLDASPPVTRKKANDPSRVSPLSATFSPRRKSHATMRTAHNRPRNTIASISPRGPKRTSTNKNTSLHASLDNLNYNHSPPPPPFFSTSPISSMRRSFSMRRSSSTSTLSTSRRSKNAPPPPQTALERISIKIKHKAELKAEKNARKEKLMQ